MAEFPLNYSDFSKEEWQAITSLVNGRRVVISETDKGSWVVVWDHEAYIADAEGELWDVTVYINVVFKDKMLPDLAETSSKL